jgi:hypothetical protein
MMANSKPILPTSRLEQSNLLQQMISPNDVVLDLGSFASGTTQALLSRRCHCFVEDIPEFINSIKIHDDFDFEDALREHMVVAGNDVKIDVILTWDLFHYLDLTEINSLFNILKDKIGPGTVIHSTRYTGSDIPERPQLFRLSDDLSYKMLEEQSTQKIVNFSHATIALLTQLKYFSLNDTLTHSSQFSKGLVEYSLIYSEENNNFKPVRSVSFELKQPGDENQTKPIGLPNLTKTLMDFSNNKTGCIIDCGGSLHSNYQRLSSCSDFVLEEDVHASLSWQQRVTISTEHAFDEQLFNYQDSVNFDLVLMWDIVNFCTETQFRGLIGKLNSHLSPNSLLHFVLPHSGQTAKSPANFRIDNQFQIELYGSLSEALSGEEASKVITTGQLVRLLPGFKVLAYYFGTDKDEKNYQEFLFQYTGRADFKK